METRIYATSLARRTWLRARQLFGGRERRRRRLVRAFVSRHGLTVRGGPFEGMTYVDRAVGPVLNLVPRLLGAYERELHAAIREVVREAPSVVVNVGSADGYYAVGLALRLPAAKVYAFDVDPYQRSLCGELARANDVADRVRLGPKCDTSRLLRLPQRGAFVLVDCEGCEIDVLRPDRIPLLRRSKVVVEIHERTQPAAASEIPARFSETHELCVIHPEPRRVQDYPDVRGLGPGAHELVLDEFRLQNVRWALFTPR